MTKMYKCQTQKACHSRQGHSDRAAREMIVLTLSRVERARGTYDVAFMFVTALKRIVCHEANSGQISLTTLR